MHRRQRHWARLFAAGSALLALVASCGLGDDNAVVTADDTTGGTTADTEGHADANEGDAGRGENGTGEGLPNACPVEGCRVFITDAVPAADGAELTLTFEANFTPDFERNHIHVFWDSQDPGAVTSDFQDKGFTVQGRWDPTDHYPRYDTHADASVTSDARVGSRVICVEAADGDHVVIDAGLYVCKDVASLVS
jgi:hypothetical protein